MPSNVLVKNSELYRGKYVATRSFKDRKVVCSSHSAMTVYRKAKEKGVRDPVIVFVPKKDTANIL